MQIEWVGAGRRDADNSQADPSRLLNMYRENLNGRTVIKGVLGTQTFAELSGVFMRAMAEVGGKVYAANGGKLSQIDTNGTVTVLGDIASTKETAISSNNGLITVASGNVLHVFDGSSRTLPDTGAFSAVGSVSFIGQRTILTEYNGRRIQWSGVADAQTYDGLDFATAEQRDDVIIRGVAMGGAYWVFKAKSIEQWYITGSDNFIAYRPGSLIEFGLKGFGLYTDVPNGGFFVGTDNIAYLASGGSMQPVSIRGVETALAENVPDRCFYYEDEGHKFCVIRFKDRPAWVYDVSMSEWHERAEGDTFAAWSAVDAVKAFGGYLIGTETGSVRKLAQNNYDAVQPLWRRAVSANLNIKGEYFSIDSLEFLGTIGQANVGVLADMMLGAGNWTPLDAGLAEPSAIKVESLPSTRGAMVEMRLSKDRGVTFGRMREKSLGNFGEYDRVVKFRSLGVARNACIELTITDPVEVSFNAQAEINIS